MASRWPDLRPNGDRWFAVGAKLDGVTVLFDLRWAARAGAWFVVVTTEADVPLSPQLRVSPGGEILLDTRDPRCPPGRLVWRGGRDPYPETDLGTSLLLEYIEASDG